MLYKTASISNKGGRSKNEDFCGNTQTELLGCWVAADGLGGHAAGEVASKIAVSSILAAFKDQPRISEDRIKDYLQCAQEALLQYQAANRQFSSMRTTVVVLLIQEGKAVYAHVGDSRLYFFKRGKIEIQTKDHSVSQSAVQAGYITAQQIRFHEDRNRLLRVLGAEGALRPAIASLSGTIDKGDAFLLCTDGFWEYVLEEEMEDDLKKSGSPEEWISKMEKRLLGRVKGEHDNYSAVAVMAV